MKKHKAGFTLIEILVATSLVSIFTASSFLVILSCCKIYKKVTISIQKMESGLMALNRISSDISSSPGIDISSTSSILKLPSGISYDCSGNKIRRIDSGYASYLTTEIIQQMAFSYPDNKSVITTICMGNNLTLTSEAKAQK